MSKKIVVVDDDPHAVRILAMILDRQGYETVKVTDSEVALQTIQEMEPAVVFIDVMMPGKNGYQICRDIRSDATLNHQPYIIMLTARGMTSERKRAERSGADEFMTKPFSPSQLADRVRQVLE